MLSKDLAVNKLYIIPAGHGMLKAFFFNTDLGADNPQMLYSPLCVYLLDTTDGPILVDTGFAEVFLNNPDYYKGTPLDGLLYMHMKEEHRLPELLKRVGYRPEDIKLVIATHFHSDHSGGNPYFLETQTPVLVQKKELTVLDDDDYSPPACRIKDLNYQVIDGDYQLCDNIRLISTPGHSPGHQSILINTASSGYVLLCIDAALTEANFRNNAPYAAADPELAAASLKKIQTTAAEYDAFPIFGHDEKQAKAIKVYPEYY
ncbi:N-acyl homoserine lactonase family protein [Mucilaginibacter sp. SG564]|uniref:N-acyl homoserine lactonase family protein n=1 Tax=unclassified Mucilaginibacter TaxID=2617802 RepID=UPI0015580E72|nr:N-acyl homoserine lactonase family protein [Mucilaginibacter sp. SG564]NOW96259.1 N-acyl homoserine lactone hydrolase [Mucilaginibacter sp. SG564]